MDQCVYIRPLREDEGGGGTMWSDDCRRRPIDVDFFSDLFRVRPKPAAKLHYMKVKDAYE